VNYCIGKLFSGGIRKYYFSGGIRKYYFSGGIRKYYFSGGIRKYYFSGGIILRYFFLASNYRTNNSLPLFSYLSYRLYLSLS
jgi:hypothetical protein